MIRKIICILLPLCFVGCSTGNKRGEGKFALCPVEITVKTTAGEGETTQTLKFGYEDGRHPYRLTDLTTETRSGTAGTKTGYGFRYDGDGRIKSFTRQTEGATQAESYTLQYDGNNVTVSGAGGTTSIQTDGEGNITQGEGLGLFSYRDGDIHTIDYVTSFLYTEAKSVFHNVEMPRWFQVYFYRTFVGDNRLLMCLFYSKRRSPSSVSVYKYKEMENTSIVEYFSILGDFPSKARMITPEGNSYIADIGYTD